MKILLVLPYDTTYRYKTAFLPALSYQPLTLSTLAALIPVDLNAEITLVDEGVQVFDYDADTYDIVGISIVTSSSHRGYALADHLRARGSYILIGGHHATLLPDEAQLHADTVFTGSAEQTFPAFFADYRVGTPKPRYESSDAQAALMPIARRDLMPKKGYLKQPTIIADYGCSNRCYYCVIHSFWGHDVRHPVARVIDEMKQLGAKEYLFLDPSPLCNRTYAKELFAAMAKLHIKWAGLATLDIAQDEELLTLMQKSGCVGTLLGFETFSQQDLNQAGKYKNKVENYAQIVARLHAHGMAVLGTFMLGMDSDTKESLQELPELIAQAKIDVPRYAVITPYPGTPFYDRIDREGRLLHKNWALYDSVHCVFQPRNMTPQELEAAFLRVWKDTYSSGRILRRLTHTPQLKTVALVTNVGFKIYASRLKGLL